MFENFYLPTLTGFAEGAVKSTSAKPLSDNTFDKIDNTSSANIRRQLHYLNVNNTDVPSIISKATARTIGVNVNIKVTSPNELFNTSAEAFIKVFSKINNCELTGKHHLNSAFRAVSDFDLLDGGIIIRHHYNSAWRIPYKFELVPISMIDMGKWHRRGDTAEPYTVNGLVYNEWNQITDIWLYSNDDRTQSVKVPMSQITYYSDVWVSIGQQTAISKLASILPTIDQLNVYQKAELDNAIEMAKSGAFLKSTAYNEIMLVLKDLIGEASAKRGVDKLKDTYDYAKPILERLSSIGVKPYGLTPIPSGDDIQFDTRRREGIYQTLNDKAEMKMGSALGMSALSIYSKANEANYSALKFVNETDQLSADIRFDNLSAKVFDEILRRAIEVGIQTSQIIERTKYWSNPSLYNSFRYLRQIHIDIEPSKNATANKTNIETGVDTEADIVERREGVDYQDWLKRRNENLMLKIRMDLELEKYKQDLKQKLGIIDDTNTEGVVNE